jgi:UDP-N-acetylglucosamine 2-epimerase (non-hydrolysing)
LQEFHLVDRLENAPNLNTIEPLSYIPFMSLVHESMFVITDSGGIQEETTYLNIPCLTLRDTTERPITVSQGTNRLVKPNDLLDSVDSILAGDWESGKCPALWDGRTASRVVKSLRKRLVSE